MPRPAEARIDLLSDERGRLVQTIYVVAEHGQWQHVRTDEYGPFDTLSDALVTALKELSPYLRLPLR